MGVGYPSARATGATFRGALRSSSRLPRADPSPVSTTQPTTPPPAEASAPDDELVVSVVIPCLNEEGNIERCVTAALEALRDGGIAGEVVVADNASEDRSADLAAAAGARVVHEPRRGYGSAYLAGFG